MIDLLLGAGLALLLVRGWFRGFVREAMDLVGLLAGVVAAFRLSGPVGGVIADMSGAGDDVARFVAGVALFFAVGLAAAVAARALERHARMPGMNLVNRASGAGLALAWGVFVATLLLSLLAILPVPSAVSGQLDDSAVSQALTRPGGVPQRVFTRLSGDRIVQTLLGLRDAVGARRLVLEGDETLLLPETHRDRLQRDDAAAAGVYERLNRARVDAGLDPLAWAPALAGVGADHAFEMYTTGRFAHRSPATGSASDRLAAAGIVYRVAGENLAMAATAADVHRGLMASDGHRANILSVEFRRVGVGVVAGPLGLMTVQVFTG